MHNIIPLSKLVWYKLKSSHHSMTLLDMASSCMALDSLRLLIGNNHESISQEEIRSAIKSLLGYSNSPFHIHTTDTQDQYDTQKLALSLLLDITPESKDETAIPKPDNIRQTILDTALLESCTAFKSHLLPLLSCWNVVLTPLSYQLQIPCKIL